jgi:alanine racemase
VGARAERADVEIGAAAALADDEPAAAEAPLADGELPATGGSPNGLAHHDGPRTALPPLRIHLEVETGMGRAGIAVGDVPAAAREIESTPGAVLAGLWSHLGSPDDEVRSAGQAARFGAAADLLHDAGIAMPVRHFAASGALLAGSAPTYDSVRPGLAIYGVVPDGLAVGERYLSTADALRPVMSLHAMPVRVAELASGTSISYGSTFVTRRRSRIATLPVGYADGLTRTLSNRMIALLRGRRVPLVGTIAMDAVMVDVTGVEGAPVTVDDEFVLLGSQDDERIDAVELGQLRTTISWEVLATMARRLPRVYHSAGRPVGLRTLTDEKGLWLASSSGTGISAISRSTRSSTRPTSRSGWPRGSGER